MGLCNLGAILKTARALLFAVLLLLLQAAGFDKVLSDPQMTGTLFAPTNAAFNALAASLGYTSPQAFLQNTEYLSKVGNVGTAERQTCGHSLARSNPGADPLPIIPSPFCSIFAQRTQKWHDGCVCRSSATILRLNRPALAACGMHKS
jgi:hypothetical protein